MFEEFLKLTRRSKSHVRANCRTELGMPPELIPLELTYYQSLAGHLRWDVELSRVANLLEIFKVSLRIDLSIDGLLD